jgi:hypothetical protein
MRKAFLTLVALAISIFWMAPSALAAEGNIIVTGHDNDFHQSAQAMAQLRAMITFARSCAPNPALKVLTFDHKFELTTALVTLGIPFDNVDPDVGVPSAALFNTAIYSAIIVASDQSCGGCDNTTTSSANLAAAVASFTNFYSNGGGLVGLSGSTNLNYYDFLPIPVKQFGGPGIGSTGFVQTAYGAEIGVPAVNGDPTHDFFNQPGSDGTDPAWGVVEIRSGTVDGVVDGAVTLAIRCGSELQVNYFAGANGSRPDQTVRITNTGTAIVAGDGTADLCANIYVFRNDQQMTECCSCLVTPNGLRTLSVDFDLARNPLTSPVVGEGVIKIVSSNTTGTSCPLAKAGTPYAAVRSVRA